MLDWLTDIISSLARWAYWIGRDNGPAVGRRSRSAWRGLAFLGRAQFWAAMMLLGGLLLWWTYAV